MKLVFAGTKMGREYVEKMLDSGEEVIVSTATEYGASLYSPHERLTTKHGKMDLKEMKEFIIQNPIPIDEIIDITHPYAIYITENVVKCCKELGIPYRSLERDSYIKEHGSKEITLADDFAQASNYLSKKEGNILLAIGSNNLEIFQGIDKDRLFIRVLPTSAVLKKCEDLGYNPRNIIAIQGPFSYQMNKSIIEDLHIKFLVTKDSGKSGGVEEKVQAALDDNVEVVMVKRNVG